MSDLPSPPEVMEPYVSNNSLGSVLMVTGGSGRIGRAISRAARRFGTVVVHGRRAETLRPVLREVHESGQRAVGVTGNLERPEEAKRVIDLTYERVGRIDVLVNNAGSTGREEFEDAENITLQRWEEVLSVNLTASFVTSQTVFPIMSSQGGGHVLNVGSFAGTGGFTRLAPYSAAKAGLIPLSRTLAGEWAPANVRVNCVVLGPVMPDEFAMTASDVHRSFNAERLQGKGLVWQRDVVKTILNMVEDLDSCLTGAVVTLEGCSQLPEWESLIAMLRAPTRVGGEGDQG